MNAHRLKRVFSLSIGCLTLDLSRPLEPFEATLVRGYVGNLMPESALIHQHDGERLIYSYPRIQYKVIDEQVRIIGIQEGVSVLINLTKRLMGEDINLAGERVSISSLSFDSSTSDFGLSDQKIAYRFMSPWLALNENNYTQYKRNSDYRRLIQLKKILTGNILSMAKGLQIIVPEPIHTYIDLKECEVMFKEIPLLGFVGDFKVNFLLPDYLGLGKSVSRGFGTVVRKSSSE